MPGLIRKWLKQDDAVVAIEAGMLFPVLITILCGTMDMGVGLITNQKVLTASQTIGDLLAREDDITDVEMNDSIAAGRLSIRPYSTATFAVDIAGVQFIGEDLTPTVIWRDTIDMEPNMDVTEDSEGLGLEDEGVIAVTVRYNYSPYFSTFMTGDWQMEEVAYVRGRKGLFVTRNAEEG